MEAELNTYNATSTKSNTYWDLLKDLAPDIKLDLIAKLSNSLLKRGNYNTKSNWTESFAGKWQDDHSAEEIIADIRNSRHFSERDFDL
jgi:hypothetical protein